MAHRPLDKDEATNQTAVDETRQLPERATYLVSSIESDTSPLELADGAEELSSAFFDEDLSPLCLSECLRSSFSSGREQNFVNLNELATRSKQERVNSPS